MVDMTDPSDLSACSMISIPDGKLTEAMVLLRSRGEQLDTISKVNLWGLGISDASILRKMTNLRIVSMSTNFLCSLDSFSACIQLQELYLRSNRIGDIHQVAHLKFLTKLQKLWLENNPCCETEPKEQCRYSIVRNLTSLTHLDLKVITQEERDKSAVDGILLTAPPPWHTPPSVEAIIPPDQAQICHIAPNNLTTEETTNMGINSVDGECDDAEPMHVIENENTSSQQAKGEIGTRLNENTINGTQIILSNSRSPPDNSLDFDVNSATLIETNKIRHECGLEPLMKNKISAPVRSLQPPAREQERLIRNAVLRLLRTLNSRSLETIIHAAERQIYRLERNRIESSELRQSVQEEADWEENSNYDCSNYLDNTL